MLSFFTATCRRCQQAEREMDIDTLEAEVIRHRKQAIFWLGVGIMGFLIIVAALFV